MSSVRYSLGGGYNPASAAEASSGAGNPPFSFVSDPNGEFLIQQVLVTSGTYNVYRYNGLFYSIEWGLHESDGNFQLSPGSGGFNFDFYDNLGGVDIQGGDYSDILRGGAGNDTLSGGGGNDLLEGGLGDNVLDGGSGLNTVSYAHFNNGTGLGVSVDLSGGLTLDVLYTGDFVETLSNLQNIRGSAYIDVLTGDAGRNVIEGGAGSDILDGGDGVDTVSYAHARSGVVVDLSNSGPQAPDTASDSTSDYVWNFENVIGGKYADELTGDDGSNALNGGAGNDTLTGLGGNDRYYVSVGDVVIEQADGGKDAVYASSDYTLSDNVENLYAYGKGGDAGVALTGNALNNYIFGGDGADTLTGLGGDDRYYVGVGDTVVEAADGGVDTVLTHVDFTLSENVENLIALKSAGLELTGNDLANVIKGNGGADTIVGGAGRDKLYGGGGNDAFAFHAVSDGNLANFDKIYDFVSGADVIDLSGIQAVSRAGADQAFSWIGEDAFSQTAGELHQRFAGASTIVEGDVNGDGHTDFRLVLAGHLTLSATDFIL